MILGIVGSRKRYKSEDYESLLNRVVALNPTMIVSGGCWIGADAWAQEIAEDHGIPITIYHPALKRWIKYKYWEVTKANYARNELIAKNCTHLIALVSPDRKGGTENTIKHFKKHHPTGVIEIL